MEINIPQSEKEECLDSFINKKRGKRKVTRYWECRFQTEWTQSVERFFKIKGIEYVYEKIKDLGDTNLYDCYVRFMKRHVAMEVKIDSAINIINFRSLFPPKSEHEIDSLEKEIRIGFEAFVILNHYNKKSPHNFNNVYAIPTQYVRKFHNKGSVHIDEIKKVSLQIHRARGFWDVSDFFKLF